VEKALAQRGVSEPWVALVARRGLSTMGLYYLYMTELHPWTREAPIGGLVAVEARVSGLDPRALRDRDFLAGIDPALVLAGEGELPDPARAGLAASLRVGDFDRVARSMLWGLHLFRDRETLARVVERARGRMAVSGNAKPRWMTVPGWSRGEKGFNPDFTHHPGRGIDRQEERAEEEGEMSEIGETQTEFLRRLVRQATADGFRVVVYLMPVTDRHLQFLPPGMFERGVEHFTTVCREEGVPFVDLHTGNALEPWAFSDTHHLHVTGAEIVSERFAEQVVLPYLP
jgi:hypothetical protein